MEVSGNHFPFTHTSLVLLSINKYTFTIYLLCVYSFILNTNFPFYPEIHFSNYRA